MTIAARTANRPFASLAASPQGDTSRPVFKGKRECVGTFARGLPAPTMDWLSRLAPERSPRVEKDTRAGGRLLIPTPLAVGEELAKVRAGQVLTLSELRSRLAERFGADRACPLRTGQCARVLAGVVAQDLRLHRRPRWPIWRLVRDNGVLPPNWALDAL